MAQAQPITPSTEIPAARASFKKGAAAVVLPAAKPKEDIIMQNNEGHIKETIITDKGGISADTSLLGVADQVLINMRKSMSEEKIQSMLEGKGNGPITFEPMSDEEINEILPDEDMQNHNEFGEDDELDENTKKIIQTFKSNNQKPHTERVTKLVRTTPPETTKVCLACSFSNIPPTAKYCPECGNPLMSKFCMQCGYQFTNKEKFCPECGTNR